MSRANPSVGDVFFMADTPDRVLSIKHIMNGKAWLESDTGLYDAVVPVEDLKSNWSFQRPLPVRGAVTVKKVAGKQAWTLESNQDLDADDMLELAWRILKKFDPECADLKRGMVVV